MTTTAHILAFGGIRPGMYRGKDCGNDIGREVKGDMVLRRNVHITGFDFDFRLLIPIAQALPGAFEARHRDRRKGRVLTIKSDFFDARYLVMRAVAAQRSAPLACLLIRYTQDLHAMVPCRVETASFVEQASVGRCLFSFHIIRPNDDDCY